MSDASIDLFEADYTAGVLRADPPPRLDAAELAAGDFLAEAMPPREFALAACVLTSERIPRRGFVWLGQATITAVTARDEMLVRAVGERMSRSPWNFAAAVQG